jgi:hypothetical protein
VEGQLFRLPPLHRNQENVIVSIPVAGKGDGPAIRRKSWRNVPSYVVGYSSYRGPGSIHNPDVTLVGKRDEIPVNMRAHHEPDGLWGNRSLDWFGSIKDAQGEDEQEGK